MSLVLFCHELRRGRLAWALWTLSIAGLVGACVLLWPAMESGMEDVGAMFAGLGAFSTAFGMDRLDIGSFAGYYGVECGNVLGLCGALYAGMGGAAALEREEREHTAEFLLTHSVPRAGVAVAKLAALLVQVSALNVAVLAVDAACMAVIGLDVPWRAVGLLHVAWVVVHGELALLCFGLSAWLRRGAQGLGLGLAALAYFLDLVANLAPTARFLKHITPFACAAPADLLAEGHLDAGLALPGLLAGVLAAGAGMWHYARKDIHA